MFITTQDIVNFRNPTAEVLPVEKDFTDKSKYTVKVNLMDLNFCSPTMSSFDPCLAKICKLKLFVGNCLKQGFRLPAPNSLELRMMSIKISSLFPTY